MYYFVIGSNGLRYGPADVDTLVAWVREGRIVPDTQLLQRGAERAIRAAELPALAAILRVSSAPERFTDGSIRRSGSPADEENPTVTLVPADPIAVRIERRPGKPSAAGPPTSVELVRGWPDEQASGAWARQRPPETLGYAGRRGLASPRRRIVAGLLGILFGGLGVHRFYLGYPGIGLFMLIVSIVTMPFLCGLVWVWGFVEGVLCLLGGMRDAEGRELRV